MLQAATVLQAATAAIVVGPLGGAALHEFSPLGWSDGPHPKSLPPSSDGVVASQAYWTLSRAPSGKAKPLPAHRLVANVTPQLDRQSETEK